MAPTKNWKPKPGESSQLDSRVLIRGAVLLLLFWTMAYCYGLAFRVCILPNKKLKSPDIMVSVENDKKRCKVINGAIDQEFKNPFEVPPNARVVIKYKSTQTKRKQRITITHAILRDYLTYGGTEFCVFNNIGSFTLNMAPCQSKQPDTPQDSSLDKETRNHGVLNELQEAGGIASERKTVLERLRWGAYILDGLVSAGKIATGVHPAVDAIVFCMDFLAKVLQNEAQMKDGIKELIDDMSDILVCALETRKYASLPQLEKTIRDLENLAKEVKDFVEAYNHTSQARVLLLSFSPRSVNQDGVKDLKDKLSNFRQRFDSGVSVQGLHTLGRALEEFHGPHREFREMPMFADIDEKVLSSLNRKQPTRRALRCFENTRLGVRQEIDDWADDFGLDSRNILLMTGYPGVGKSTVAFQMAYDLSRRNRFGLIVDFDRTSETDPEVVWSTFAYEIAKAYPACGEKIVSTLKGHTFRLENATASDILQRLVIEPLKECRSTFEPGQFPVFILDALDECGGLGSSASDKKEKLLSHIREWSKLPREFKLIVTSRDVSDIRNEFKTIPHETLEIKTGSEVTEESTSDINLYIQDAFKKITRKHRLPPLPADWPGSDVETGLAERAGGVFIWAVTALEYIAEGNPIERLRTIRGGGLPGGGVHTLYRQILETFFPDNTQSSLFVKLAGVVIAARRYLTAEDWARLLQMDKGTVGCIHSMLRTVVVDADVIRFRHDSFVDFLLGSNDGAMASSVNSRHEASCPERFRVDVSEAHHTLTQASFLLMNSNLRFNICSIDSSYLPNNRSSSRTSVNGITPALAYVCEFWEFHMQQLRPPHTIDTGLILRFLQEILLYWIESLSVLGIMNIAVNALDILRQHLMSTNRAEKAIFENALSNLIPRWFHGATTQSIDAERGLYEYSIAPLVVDSTKFIQYFSPALSVSAAHMYISALPFSPRSSRLSHIYASKFKNIMTVDTGRLLDWPAEQIVIRKTGPFRTAVFSHSSNLIASGSEDGSVHVWDAGAEEIVVGPLQGHTGWVIAIAFSHDSRRVVSGSNDKTIRIWDVETGEMLVGPLTGHDDYVSSVALSRDGKYVASGSRNGEIRLWNARQDETTHDTKVLGVHGAEIVSVTFSRDDEHLISGSVDNRVVIWNVRSSVLVAGPFDCHPRYFCTVPITIGSRFVAAGSSDSAVLVWDVESKKPIGDPFRRHRDLNSNCSFSHDGTRAVLCSGHKPIRVCDVQTSETVAGPFSGHSHWANVNSVSFSHDDKRIVSCSDDGTIRIWDSEVGESVQESFQGHTADVNCVALSYDGTWIVSGSDDKTIRIWETTTGKMVGKPLEGLEGLVLCVAFSQDGKRVVSGSWDWSIRVWDTKTSKCVLGPIKGHRSAIRSVAFSHDGRRIVSCSRDKTIRIWNADTGDLMLPPIDGHGDWVYSVAFSHDDTRVVSGSFDKTIRIWNTETGEMVGRPFTGHQGWIRSVAFSHDSKYVVSGSHDKTVRVWDVDTGEMIAGPFKGHEDWVLSVAFSADSKLVVSGSQDRTIRVWNVESGETVIGPLKGHEGDVRSVAITNDGKSVVSGSRDSTIRVWDLTQLHGPFTNEKQRPDTDGWVRSESGELLFWVPRIHRHSFYAPRNLVVIGRHATRVDYSHLRVGRDWKGCNTSDKCS